MADNLPAHPEKNSKYEYIYIKRHKIIDRLTTAIDMGLFTYIMK